jgi:hypothetical protein
MTPLDKLARRFQDRCTRGNNDYARAVHPPKTFRQWVATKGAVWACKKLFDEGIATEHRPEHNGFTDAFLVGRLDLTVEYMVWDEPEWKPLFTIPQLEHIRIVARLYDFEKVRAHRALLAS